MALISPTYIFESATQIFRSNINRNFDDIFCQVNAGLGSQNIISSFAWQASQIRVSSCLVNSSPLYTSLQVEDLVSEMGGDWFNLSGASAFGTTVSTVLKAFDSQITVFESANHYVPRRPTLLFQNCRTIEVEENGDTCDTTLLRFPNGTLRRVQETSAGTRFRFLTISQTFTFSATAVAQAGVSTILSAQDSPNTSGVLCVYAVGICGTTEFSLGGKINALPSESSVLNLDADFGVNNWFYLGSVKLGAGGSVSGLSQGILSFIQTQDLTFLTNCQTIRQLSQVGFFLTEISSTDGIAYNFSTQVEVPFKVLGSHFFFHAVQLSITPSLSNLHLEAGGRDILNPDTLSQQLTTKDVGGYSSNETICTVGIVMDVIFLHPDNFALNAGELTLTNPTSASGYKSISLLGWRDRFLD